MKCPKCGKINLTDSIFCEACGARLKEEKPIVEKSSNAWKWVAIVSTILFMVSIFVNIGGKNSSSNEQYLKNTISNLNNQIVNLNSKISNLEHENAKLKSKSSNTSYNDAYYKQQIQSLNQQIKNLQNSTNQSNNNVSSTELRNLRNELKKLKEKNSALETQLSNQVQELTQLRTERDALKVKLFSSKR